jgi:CelD/BcsL family acetyltransferase involved in cellulose biosynthesis
MERKGAPRSYFFPEAFFSDLLSKVEGAFLRVIYVGERFAGGSMAIQEGDTVNDYLRATDPAFWNLRVNDFVIHDNVRFFRRRGARTYDLQGGRSGVFQFKQSFSQLTRPFKVGSMVHLPEEYESLCRLVPERSPDFFPAYREKDTN